VSASAAESSPTHDPLMWAMNTGPAVQLTAHFPVVMEVKKMDDADHLIPDSIVQRELGGVSKMTIFRWTRDPTLNFPPPVRIKSRNYRSRRALDDFKAKLMAAALKAR
jgi:predicted DNA-binding transcriptional regulator AlpA